MAYVALYRQWRPQDFDTLAGQEHISVTLKNAIAADRVAHAYLFAGPRGTGKTSTAKILAKALNCVQGPTVKPCNVCPNCAQINAGSSMDVFEVDAASNRGIDEIRDLRETVKFAPVAGRYKIYIIDEVHMLTTEAFNALLKTLEEPPSQVVFILATTEPHKIPATIHSRCQRYDFRRIKTEIIEERLAEVALGAGLKVEAAALKMIAVQAEGGMRDALSVLDQCAALTEAGAIITAQHVRQLLGLIGHEWIWALTAAVAERDSGKVLLTLADLLAAGKDVRQLLAELIQHFRSLMLYKAAPELPALAGLEMYSGEKELLAAQSKLFSHGEITKLLGDLHTAANEIKWAADPRIIGEMTLLAACRRAADDEVTALAARVAALEERLAAGVAVTAAAAQPEKQLTGGNVSSTAVQQAQILTPRQPPQPQPVAQRETAATTVAPAAALKPDSSMSAVWAALLKELLAAGKRSVHACVMQGKLVSLNSKQAEVRFTANFPKERTEKEDYRLIVENILAQVLGRKVQLCCSIGAVAAEKATTPAAAALATAPDQRQAAQPVLSQTAAESLPTVTAAVAEALPVTDNPPAVQAALKLFGGGIVKPGED